MSIKDFLVNPYLVYQERSATAKTTLLHDIIILPIVLITASAVILGGLQLLVVWISDVDFQSLRSASDTVNSNLFTSTHGAWLGITKVVFIAPILEELMYRLSLSLSKHAVIICISTFLFFFVGDPILKMDLYSSGTKLKLLVTAGFLIISYFTIQQHYLDPLKTKRWIYLMLFYGLAIYFASRHSPKLINEVAPQLQWLKPLYVLPQFLLAIAASYMRLRYGILYAILLHMLFNAPATAVYLLKLL